VALTFENLIDHNKRSSAALIFCMIVFVIVLGSAFSVGYAGYRDFEYAKDTALFGALIGAIIAFLAALFSYYAGNHIIMGISNARRVDHALDPILFNVVEEMAIAAGIPPPKIYAIPDESPNAFATGRDPEHAVLAITTGLRKKLSRDELQAVVAHEVAHIKSYDTRLMMLTGVFAGVIVLVSDFFVRSYLDRIRLRGGRREYEVKPRNSIFYTPLDLSLPQSF